MIKIAIFIDGSSMFYAQRDNKWYIDFKKVLDYFTRNKEKAGAYYFSATPPAHLPDRVSAYRRFRNALIYIGYEVVDKEVKIIHDKETGATKVKGNLDIELVFRMLSAIDTFDEIVLLGGDSDYEVVLSHLKNNGKIITCVGNKKLIAREIINISNNYIDLNDIRNMIEKARWI